jgi:hypothetical protein
VDGVTGYPPEPWQLRGDLHASVLLVPADRVPLDLPPRCRAVRVAGRAVVGLVWVDYRPGGVLSYRELMATALVRRGAHIMPHIVAIWVDSAESRAGGRALWGIPKELAEFTVADGRFAAVDEKGGIARAEVRRRAAVPGRWPLRFSVVQRLAGAAKISPVRSRGRLALAHAAVDVDPDGPLGFLAGVRPLLSASLTGFEMCFGRRPANTASGSR